MRKSDRKNGEEARAIQWVLETDHSLAPTMVLLLGQGGEAGATGHRGGGSNGGGKATSVAGLQRLARPQSLYVTDVAGRPLLRATSPPQPRGDFSCNLPARDRNWTKTSDAGCEVTTSRKGGSRRLWLFRVKAWS